MPKYSEAVVLEVFELLNNVLGDDAPGMGDEMGGEVPPVPADDEDVFDDEAFGVPDDGAEAEMGDAPMGDEPPADGPDDEPEPAGEPDGDEEPARYASDCEDGEVARYDSSMSAPSATNVSLPATAKKEKARMGRSTTEPQAPAAGSQELLDRIAKLEAENAKLARYNRQKNLESKFSALKHEGGFTFEVADEIDDLIDADDAAVEKRIGKIKAHYTRSPEHVGNIASDATEAGSAKDPEWYGTGDELNAWIAWGQKVGDRDEDGESLSRYRRAVSEGKAEAPKPRVSRDGRRSNYR